MNVTGTAGHKQDRLYVRMPSNGSPSGHTSVESLLDRSTPLVAIGAQNSGQELFERTIVTLDSDARGRHWQRVTPSLNGESITLPMLSASIESILKTSPELPSLLGVHSSRGNRIQTASSGIYLAIRAPIEDDALVWLNSIVFDRYGRYETLYRQGFRLIVEISSDFADLSVGSGSPFPPNTVVFDCLSRNEVREMTFHLLSSTEMARPNSDSFADMLFQLGRGDLSITSPACIQQLHCLFSVYKNQEEGVDLLNALIATHDSTLVFKRLVDSTPEELIHVLKELCDEPSHWWALSRDMRQLLMLQGLVAPVWALPKDEALSSVNRPSQCFQSHGVNVENIQLIGFWPRPAFQRCSTARRQETVLPASSYQKVQIRTRNPSLVQFRFSHAFFALRWSLWAIAMSAAVIGILNSRHATVFANLDSIVGVVVLLVSIWVVSECAKRLEIATTHA